MPGNALLRLTYGEIDALLSLCAYASAGGPEDVSMDPKIFARIPSAHRKLWEAKENRK